MLYIITGVAILFTLLEIIGVNVSPWVLYGCITACVVMFIPFIILHAKSFKKGFGEGEVQEGTIYVPHIEMEDGSEFHFDAPQIVADLEDDYEGPISVEAVVQDDFKKAMWYFKLLNFRGIAPTVTLYATKK